MQEPYFPQKSPSKEPYYQCQSPGNSQTARQQPPHAAPLIDGWMTPRMSARLENAASALASHCNLNMPDFEWFWLLFFLSSGSELALLLFHGVVL